MQIENIIRTLTKAEKAFHAHKGNKEYTKKTLNFLKAANEIGMDHFSSLGEQTLSLRLRTIINALWAINHDDLALELNIHI
jgi:hypothetical protein